jgi:di-heme oxidoreductase (putative peroxidase)
MSRRIAWIVAGFVAGVAATLWCSRQLGVFAQQSERPGNSLDHPIDVPRDLTGLSIKNPRIRVVHTTDPWQAGGSMYLQEVDPWLGYQWGRSLTQRNFRERDGVYGDSGKIDGILLPDGVSKMMDRSHTNSCGTCHNVPYRDAGAGMTMSKNGATGRNTPHMFGGGLMEMIGLQMRLQALAIADANRDGWISKEEAKGKRCLIHNVPEELADNSGGADTSGLRLDARRAQRVLLDFGAFDDEDGDGYPDLNPVFWPIFVDKHGQRIAWARSLNTPEVAGYHFEVQVFGFGTPYMPFRPAISTTLRAFTLTPFDIHSGMQACDPCCFTSPKRDGLALVSNAGAQQFISAAGKDRGGVRAKTKTGLPGISLDDPDRDGYCEEISEGDLDVAEWYLLNHPAPARAKMSSDAAAGEKLFAKIGCAGCHVPDWHLQAGNPEAKVYTERFDGDRRFFDLKVAWNDNTDRLEGKLVYLTMKRDDAKGSRAVPARGAYTIRGVYSDFKYHDVGEDFYQTQFDGSVVRMWRTTPLWGVGHTAPYGHDGASLDLDSVIRRHGGEALPTRVAYAKLAAAERQQILAFLNSLILYQTDQLPCDIDGDGVVEEHFQVQGQDTGLERFQPDWLFRVPGKIEGPIRNIKGEKAVSFALTNLREAYGLHLEFLRDTDGDGFPDVIDPEPLVRGYKDGVK